jgi:ABC-type Mn2+/Zn2+ transport system ATPase subunit
LDPFGVHSDKELWEALERVNLVSGPGSGGGSGSGSETSTLAFAVANSSSLRRSEIEGEEEEEDLSGSSTLAYPSSSSSTRNFHISPKHPHSSSNTIPSLSLSTPITTNGTNLSHGQRQLLSLARALISHPKIMIMDEATSAVDTATDGLIQSSIRAEFGRNNSSLLVIAHRLSTIADFDRILVLDEGRVVEWGGPRELMGIEGGVFRNLVERSGERGVVEGVIFGRDGNGNRV